MQETLPHINIAPDRSKQNDYKRLRAELLTRRNDGEYVIIVGKHIVQDKRHHTTGHRTSNAGNALSDPCKSPLRVQMPPTKSNSCDDCSLN